MTTTRPEPRPLPRSVARAVRRDRAARVVLGMLFAGAIVISASLGVLPRMAPALFGTLWACLALRLPTGPRLLWLSRRGSGGARSAKAARRAARVDIERELRTVRTGALLWLVVTLLSGLLGVVTGVEARWLALHALAVPAFLFALHRSVDALRRMSGQDEAPRPWALPRAAV